MTGVSLRFSFNLRKAYANYKREKERIAKFSKVLFKFILCYTIVISLPLFTVFFYAGKIHAYSVLQQTRT